MVKKKVLSNLVITLKYCLEERDEKVTFWPESTRTEPERWQRFKICWGSRKSATPSLCCGRRGTSGRKATCSAPRKSNRTRSFWSCARSFTPTYPVVSPHPTHRLDHAHGKAILLFIHFFHTKFLQVQETDGNFVEFRAFSFHQDRFQCVFFHLVKWCRIA